MNKGKQNFIDQFFDKRASMRIVRRFEMLFYCALIFFLSDYFGFVDMFINSKLGEWVFLVIILGLTYCSIFIVRKCYWTLRMKKFLLKNVSTLKNNQDAFLNYYRTHAWRNVNYYYNTMQVDTD